MTTETDYATLRVEDTAGIRLVTINRADKMNALNTQVIEELDQAVQVLYEHEINGMIITGAGDKAFVAGADISELVGLSSDEGLEMSKRGQAVFNRIEGAPKPVIAAVNGFALGGGCELAMACHVRIATPEARFGQPEVNLGIIPGFGGTQRLKSYIGHGRALEHLMTGDMIDADKAHLWGLVNHIKPKEELIGYSIDMLKKIGKKGPVAVAKVIECVNVSSEEDGMGFEAEQFQACVQTEDFKEGAGAFLEKRKAEFKGR